MKLEEKKNIESSLNGTANTILIIGLIGCVFTFAASCLKWDISIFGIECKGINWFGFPSLIAIFITTFFSWAIIKGLYGILSVIDIKAENIEVEDWKRDFCVFVASKNIDDARSILYNKIINSLTFRNIIYSDNEAYKNQEIAKLNSQYKIYLMSIGEDKINIDYGNDIYKSIK